MSRTLTRRATALTLAPALVIAAAAPAHAETAAADAGTTQNATGPGSTEFSQDQVDNALRFLAVIFGAGAIVATLGAAGLYFAGPHLGIDLGIELPGLPR